MKLIALLIAAVLTLVFQLISSQSSHHRRSGARRHGNGTRRSYTESKIIRSLSNFNLITDTGKFSLTSMTVQNRMDTRWYVPHFHDRNSAGWNRTFANAFMNHPVACHIRFVGLALESSLKNHINGGTGYFTLHYTPGKKALYHGFSANETSKLHCYYLTNKGYGSEFMDKPKTLGIAIYCPVPLDHEIGKFDHRSLMQEGFYCRVLMDHVTKISVHLRPTGFSVPPDYAKYEISKEGELIGEAMNAPMAMRLLGAKGDISTELEHHSSGGGGTGERPAQVHQHRPHAVCTVQTFRNAQTGPMLYLFISYYHRLGYRVIVYDRFGFHREFIEDLLALPGFDYYPFTLFQITNPKKYNDDFAKKQGFGYKIFYKMEKSWGYGDQTNGTDVPDTADQDCDKSRTYDHCRIEYAHLDTIMYIDADELLFCPQSEATHNVRTQRRYQQRMMNEYIAQGIEEMRLVRLPYSGLSPSEFNNSEEGRAKTDFTLHTASCMQREYDARNITGMLGCWSNASSYDNFPKSADMGGVCPFHYNHWSCDGMRGGGRDHGGKNGPRCRCKVAFDLYNYYQYHPIPSRCHLLHFNDNKYRFQLRRTEAHRKSDNAKLIKAGKKPITGPQMYYGDPSQRSPIYSTFARTRGNSW